MANQLTLNFGLPWTGNHRQEFVALKEEGKIVQLCNVVEQCRQFTNEVSRTQLLAAKRLSPPQWPNECILVSGKKDWFATNIVGLNRNDYGACNQNPLENQEAGQQPYYCVNYQHIVLPFNRAANRAANQPAN